MLAYLLGYILLFVTVHTPWQFVLISLASYIFSPERERERILLSFLLAFLLFVFFLSPNLAQLQMQASAGADFFDFSFLRAIRDEIGQRRSGLSELSRELYSSLILGDLKGAGKLGALVKELGIVHLFVISGFHFSILFSSMSLLLQKVMRLPYKITLIMVLIASTLYYLILPVGFGSSRAYFTIVLGILAFFLGRSTDSENVLYTVSLFWILLFPADLFRLGFQLTFVATYLVVLCARIEWVRELESRVLQNLILSLMVSFGVSAFLAFKGAEFAIFSFLLVAVSTPVISLLMGLMFLYAILPFGSSPVSLGLARGIDFLARIYSDFLHRFSELGSYQWLLPIKLAILMQVLLLMLFFSGKLASYGWSRRSVAMLSALVLFCFLF